MILFEDKIKSSTADIFSLFWMKDKIERPTANFFYTEWDVEAQSVYSFMESWLYCMDPYIKLNYSSVYAMFDTNSSYMHIVSFIHYFFVFGLFICFWNASLAKLFTDFKLVMYGFKNVCKQIVNWF